MFAEKLPLVEGRWRNTPKNNHAPTLWDNLTSDRDRYTSKEITPDDSVVTLTMPNEETLNATLLTNGEITNSITFKIRLREPWFELATQYISHPFLWYVIWGLEARDIALGIDANGDLLVNTIGNGNFMILIVPTIGGGGAPGTVSLYERTEEEAEANPD